MLLRASGQRDDQEFDLTAITQPGRQSGVPHEAWLRQLTELTISGDWQALPAVLAEASLAMGQQQAVDALVVASAFNGITRVADATGIPLDENTADTTTRMRTQVGLDTFDYHHKSARYG